ncbi:SRPBCC family protein [Henriciella marina]|uniref:SRPBCC family protein n=1 Tax=Henriciella marina TaxID=453851 RepID=UPI000368733C|nr:hypothetical protein [Henriciella marina]
MKPLCLIAACLAGLPASADIVSAKSDHYSLRHEAMSELEPKLLWQRLVQPCAWWHPDHTYSGNADHLTLDLAAGGIWMENWHVNSVAHGTVLAVLENEMLRLDAPFGPLQGMGVNVVWTITLAPDAETGGTRIVFEEVANGSSESGLDQIAAAVDRVKQQAIMRLADPALTN